MPSLNNELKNSLSYLSDGPPPGLPGLYQPYLLLPMYATVPPFALFMKCSDRESDSNLFEIHETVYNMKFLGELFRLSAFEL